MMELKLGVHLMQYSDVQECLVDGPTDVDLMADAHMYDGAFAGIGSKSATWVARVQSRSVIDLALEHLQRALHLFEGNGEETAGVHYQLAEAYMCQLQRLAVKGGTNNDAFSSRLAAG